MSEEKVLKPLKGQINQMEVPFGGLIKEVSVLLVDQEAESITDEMIYLLELHKYKVITVMASEAMSVLIKKKKRFDVMIINVNIPDSHCFELLTQAVALNIISLFVCDEHNKLLAMSALENGAYLCLKRPLGEEIVEQLWQFVWTEKIQREKSMKSLEANGCHMNVDGSDNNNIVEDEEQGGKKNMPIDAEEQSHKVEKDVVSNEKYKLRRKRGRKDGEEIKEGEGQSSAINKTITHKNCILWTDDLHAKFMEALEQLGEGRCFPKNILEVMNVPGLTNKQISSHLQKFRRTKRTEEEMKNVHHGFSNGSQQRSSYKKYGRMPCLQTNVLNQIQRGSEFPQVNTKNIFASSTQQQLHQPQLQIQSHFLNPYLSSQNDSGRLQQHDPLFGMLCSKTPLIGSINNRSCLALNGGGHRDYNSDHRAQNDYSLDFDAAHVTTLFDIDVENTTISGLRETNANFKQYAGEQNMFNPSNIIATSDMNDIEESDPNEWENFDASFNFNHMEDLFKNPKSPNATLSNQNHDVENVTINGLRGTNANFNQYTSEQNMFDPSSIIVASDANVIEGSNSNERENFDVDFNFNHMNDLFQNPEARNATLPNENNYVGNTTINGLGETNANFKQYTSEQNMSDPSNIVAASDANIIEGNDSNEWANFDAYINFNHMDDLFQNPRSPSAPLPIEYGSGRDTEWLVFKDNEFPNK